MRQTFVVLKENSLTRTEQLAARGRGGYAPRARGRGFQGRGGGWRGGRGRGGGNADQRGQKRVNDSGNQDGSGTGRYGYGIGEAGKRKPS